MIVAFSFRVSMRLGLMCSGIVNHPAGRRVEQQIQKAELLKWTPEAEQKQVSPTFVGPGAEELLKLGQFSEL